MTRERPDPGHFIRQHLEARDWTSAELATRMQRPLREINDIIAGYREITPDIAGGLARAFETTTQYWMNHQMAWDLERAAADD